MKAFELTYLGLEPFLSPLWHRVRSELKRYARSRPAPLDILDVGGRKSHYTISLPARVAISDMPRRSELQRRLHLGIDGGIARQLRARRSNVRCVLYDDMTQSSLRSASFDCVVAVEVIEHVEKDADFVREVERVLKPGGLFFLTTQNGDYVRNTNPDHKRHYTRQQLVELLAARFGEVEVEYAIASGKFRSWGLKSWSARKPLQTARAMLGNLVNTFESARGELRTQARGTRHLIARARKPY